MKTNVTWAVFSLAGIVLLVYAGETWIGIIAAMACFVVASIAISGVKFPQDRR